MGACSEAEEEEESTGNLPSGTTAHVSGRGELGRLLSSSGWAQARLRNVVAHLASSTLFM